MTSFEMYQPSLFEKSQRGASPSEADGAAAGGRAAVKGALDELVSLTLRYRASEAYQELLQFVTKFQSYSPFNAMLVHVQRPGATFVASPHRWLYDYGRRIKADAHPLVILQPMGPVMFVFDVSDTEPTEDARPLPKGVDRPFEVTEGHVESELRWVIRNAKRDGVRVVGAYAGSQSAGSIRTVHKDVNASQLFQAGLDDKGKPILVPIPVRYDLVVNAELSPEAQYATIVHELAHLYCGHLGTPNLKWWPDRRGLDGRVEEFEAESVSYIVCLRRGIRTSSEEYLANYVDDQREVPPISVESVMKGAGLIETMSRERMKLRKAPEGAESRD